MRDGTPVGRVVADITLRTGYVKANGAEVLRADYLRLVQFADEYNLWVAESDKAAYPGLYGQGDGSTTFTLPDMRGVVERYLDDGKGYDTGRVLGSYQGDELKSHAHYIGSNGYHLVEAGKHYVPVWDGKTYSGNTGGSETRPKNIAVLAVIRY